MSGLCTSLLSDRAAQHGHVADAAARRQDRGILRAGNGSTASPIYWGGAANAQAVGWQFINASSYGKLRTKPARPTITSRFRKIAMNSISQFENALHTDEPSVRLRQLALDLAAEGYSPPAVLDLFETFRAVLQSFHREAEEDLVLETMDAIVGWCNESAKLFPTYDWTQHQTNSDASIP
jgi:hypothetical protein